MKKILPSTFLIVCLATASAVFAAETKPAAASAKTAGSFAGEFAGEWLGDNGTGGALKLTFKPGKDAAMTMEASFTFEGANVPTTTKSLQVEGSRITTVFAWLIQGTAATSKLVGELKGDRLEGTYESTTAEGGAKGTWKVARTPAKS